MSSFQRLTGKSIDEAFEEFHAANPHVYERFKRAALRLIGRGWSRYSSKSIICVIRYQRDMETHAEDGFRINDAFTACYARMFHEDFPDYNGFFETRELRRRDLREAS